MEVFLQACVSGLAQGCVYGLVALGFVLIYKGTEVANFAQGELMMVEAYLHFSLVIFAGFPPGWAFPHTLVLAGLPLASSARSGVRPMNETFPLERASEAYDRMMSGRARFRVVLT